MFKKSAISALLSVVMLLSCIVIPAGSAAAVTEGTEAAAADNVSAYKLASKVQSGNILHAFNWHFSDVKRYMKEIAGAGFTSVQVSPVQASKPTINAASFACDWWSLYQPTNFSIGNILGTKADFEEMCATAKQYGVKIIVDVIANHMAQADSGGDGKRHPDIIEDLRTDPAAWHTVNGAAGDSNRYDMTQRRLSSLPDLNTSNTKVQDYVKGLIKECLDSGADGFRFDAAKHIELPSDKPVNGISYASDFWPNITSYAKSINPNVYIYGEALAPFATEAENYTKYINITDSSYGTKVSSTVKGTTASSIVDYSIKSVSPSKLVTWIESHDNFTSGRTQKLTHEQLLIGWGLIGARKDAPALYLVRPEHETLGLTNGSSSIAYDELMGGPGNKLWMDKTVAEINKFRNAFEGQDETVAADGSQFYVQRGTSGMTLVNLSADQAQISYNVTMKDGTYTDQISGKTFTVSGGKLTGTVDAKTVAVIYNKTDVTPTASVQLDGKEIDGGSVLHFAGDTAKVKLTLNDAQSGTYSVNGAKAVAFTGAAEVTVGAGADFDKKIPVTVTATNKTGTTTETYNILKRSPDAKVVAYFNITGNESWLGDSGIYCYAKDENGKEIAPYPGIKMENVKGTKYYKAEIPGVKKATVKFNEGQVTTGLDGRTIPLTVLDYGVATVPENREAGGFDIIGTMLWEDGEWQDLLKEPQPGLITECDPYALGDTNGDGKLNITDCVTIQKSLAKILELTDDGTLAADITGTDGVTVQDVIWLQKYFAKMDVPYDIGSKIETPGEDTDYTIYFNNYNGWEQVNAYYWEDQGSVPIIWPGVPMEKVSGNMYKVTIPVKYNSIKFNNVPGTDQSNEIIVDESNHGKMFTAVLNTDGTYGIWTEKGQFPEIPDNSTKLYYENTTKWSVARAYMYNSGSGKENAVFPGVKMKKVGTNAAGNTVYSVDVEKGEYNMIVFTDGNRQSKDLEIIDYDVIYTPIDPSQRKFDCTTKPYTGLN